MNSLLALALVAPAVLANPIRRQATTGTLSFNATTLAPTSSSFPSDTLTDTDFPTPTETFSDPITSTWSPLPTGGSDRGYYYCYFPGSGPAYTETYTDVYTDTFTDTFVFTDTFTDTFTDIITDTVTDITTETVSPVPATSETGTVSEATSLVTASSATLTVTSAPLPTFTNTDPTSTFDVTITDIPTSEFPITTPAPTATGYPGHGIQTYTIVGPDGNSQVIECIRVPRWGGHPHPPTPHHPHTSWLPSGTFITSILPTDLPTDTVTISASTFTPTETATTFTS